jgi:hypothetical protein
MELAEQSPTSSAAEVNKRSCAIHSIPKSLQEQLPCSPHDPYVLCAIGSGVYLALARLFGIRELATFERMLLRRLKLRQPTLRHLSDAPPH